MSKKKRTVENDESAHTIRTRERLLAAAQEAFDEDGYFGTDTNQIARRAGFAPATFYKHFPDKRAVFLDVYEEVIAEGWADMRASAAKVAGEGGLRAALNSLVRHHKRHRLLRAAMRILTLTDETVRVRRRAHRRTHLAHLHQALGIDPKANQGRVLGTLLFIERICDAFADGEIAPASDAGKALLAQAERALLDLQAK